jgi:hypothetical protein
MNKKIFGIVLLTIVLAAGAVLASCSSSKASAQGGTFSPTKVTATVNGDNVSIPSSAITTNKNVEFDVGCFPRAQRLTWLTIITALCRSEPAFAYRAKARASR